MSNIKTRYEIITSNLENSFEHATGESEMMEKIRKCTVTLALFLSCFGDAEQFGRLGAPLMTLVFSYIGEAKDTMKPYYVCGDIKYSLDSKDSYTLPSRVISEMMYARGLCFGIDRVPEDIGTSVACYNSKIVAIMMFQSIIIGGTNELMRAFPLDVLTTTTENSAVEIKNKKKQMADVFSELFALMTPAVKDKFLDSVGKDKDFVKALTNVMNINDIFKSILSVPGNAVGNAKALLNVSDNTDGEEMIRVAKTIKQKVEETKVNEKVEKYYKAIGEKTKTKMAIIWASKHQSWVVKKLKEIDMGLRVADEERRSVAIVDSIFSSYTPRYSAEDWYMGDSGTKERDMIEEFSRKYKEDLAKSLGLSSVPADPSKKKKSKKTDYVEIEVKQTPVQQAKLEDTLKLREETEAERRERQRIAHEAALEKAKQEKIKREKEQREREKKMASAGQKKRR